MSFSCSLAFCSWSITAAKSDWKSDWKITTPKKIIIRRKRKTTAERTQLDNITSFYGFPGNKMWVFDLIFAAFSRARLSSQKFYSLFALIFTISHTYETFTRARVRAHPSPPRAPFERKTFLAHPNYGIYRLSALVDFVLCSFFRSDKVDDALYTWREMYSRFGDDSAVRVLA